MAGFDATLGGATATSYISIAEADAFLANTQYTGTWQGNTEAEKSKYLNAATFWLDTLDYGHSLQPQHRQCCVTAST